MSEGKLRKRSTEAYGHWEDYRRSERVEEARAALVVVPTNMHLCMYVCISFTIVVHLLLLGINFGPIKCQSGNSKIQIEHYTLWSIL